MKIRVEMFPPYRERRYIMKKGIQLIIAGLLALPLAGCSKQKMKLANKEITVEYGETISTEAKDYLNNDDEFLKEVKIENIPTNEQDKNYPGIGDYELILKNGDEQQKVKVYVKDRVAPEFKDLSEKYIVAYDTKLKETDFQATDLSECTISIDDKNVNYQKTGEYKASVIAKDKYNNETKKDINVQVLEKDKDINEAVKEIEKQQSSNNTKKSFKVSSSTSSSSNSGKSNSTKPSNSSSSTSSNSSSSSTSSNSGNSDTSSKVDKNNSTSEKKEDNVTKPSKPENDISSKPVTAKTSKEAFNLINAERKKQGLAPAVWDSQCERIALLRAKELSENYSHEGIYKYLNDNSNLGECIGAGFNSASGIVNGWMSSSGHKAILMEANRTHLAVARYSDYWVAINFN